MGDQRTETAGERHANAFAVVGSCAALVALGVSQPVLGLVGGSPEFFLARDAPVSDIVGLALILGLAVPFAIGGLVLAVGLLSARAGRITQFAVVALLGAFLVLQVLKQVSGESSGWLQTAAAIGAGILLAYGIHRSQVVQSLLSLAAISVIAVPVMFLFVSPTSGLVLESGTVEFETAPIPNPAPVVVVVFDELPVASLIDENGDLQERIYPGFARLAEDATWFRNAVTVQRLTQFSVPAMLSGINPQPDFIPTPVDYPQNLFTLLGDTYEMKALESLTGLCPLPACPEEDLAQVSDGQRWATTLDDLSIVAGHVLLPLEFTRHLPPIDQNWAEFGGEDLEQTPRLSTNEELRSIMRAEVDAGRGITFERFIESINPPTNSPTLHFAHVLLPHAPWDYLPNGQRYAPPTPLPGTEGQRCSEDEWLVNQGYQLHLMQTMYVDHLVGMLIDRLEDIGTYEESVVVVAADHGILFRAGTENRRAATPESIGGLAAVPLFIKAPGLSGGQIDDYRAETVDVLPTIADALGIALPWATDGVSLIGPDRPARTQSVITGGGTVTFGTAGREKIEEARHKVEVFGGSGPFGLVPENTSQYLGLELDDLSIRQPTTETAELHRPDGLDDVDLQDQFLPVLVQGSLTSGGADGEDSVVAIAVNGIVAAITRTYVEADGASAFYAVVPPDSLHDGSNQVTLLLLDESGPTPSFIDVGP